MTQKNIPRSTSVLENRKEGEIDIAIWVVTQLGPEGMSSDKSNMDENTGMEVLYTRSLVRRRSAEKEMDSSIGSGEPTGKSERLFDSEYLANHKNVKDVELKKGDGKKLQ
ncbi:hypothetical protein GALMADRAFT_212072 [Galerina marginata CBS 339.88]|uniref:Uncharacterized protein n=1 Tax=Galerina marginata (strain CBS 339.88) TaxID=685588 RepID=A0A067T3R7_GALM3|nr:hypothetical protein GALMADRAFT_212072 [Galerina marginata CBS 339.88]